MPPHLAHEWGSRRHITKNAERDQRIKYRTMCRKNVKIVETMQKKCRNSVEKYLKSVERVQKKKEEGKCRKSVEKVLKNIEKVQKIF